MRADFQAPPVSNRIRPFWFLNGEIDEAEMEYQIMQMKEKGLGGFVLCARQGLKTPYLSGEWLEICRFAVKTAKRLGMEVWLYDEFPYPSGISGGEVTIRQPQSCQHELVFTDDTVTEGVVKIGLGKVRSLSAMMYPVKDGATLWQHGTDILDCIGIVQPTEIYQYRESDPPALNQKRFFSYGPEKELCLRVPAGTFRILTASAKKIADFKYYGDFIDPADPDAVETFIETTYERYKSALGEDFGGVIKGIYGDETHFLGDHFWSFRLPEYYRNKYGEELLPGIFGILDKSFPGAAVVRYRYFQCMHELLRDRYHKRISEWCENNSLQYAAEIPVMRMSGQMYCHVPGGDPNHDKLGTPLGKVIERDFLGLRSNTKVLSAIARQYGRRDSMIESFHSIGWSMTLQDAKWQIDRETLMGASMHVFHAFFYTVDGITKHDAAPSQFIQNPYWEHYRKLADYCGRSSLFVTDTYYAAKVAVFHPMTSWWTSLINPMLRMKYTGNDAEEERDIRRLLDDYLYLCRTLLFYHIDYDDLDAETMEKGVVKDGLLRVGKASYSTIVVPPVTNMEGFAGKKLKELAASGGKVIFCGLTPFESVDDYCFARDWAEEGIELEKTDRELYRQGSGQARLFTTSGGIRYLSAPGGLEKSNAGEILTKAVREAAPAFIRLWIEEKNRGKIAACRREDEAYRYLFVTCCEGEGGLCRISVPEEAPFYDWSLENGAKEYLKTGDSLEIELGPWETRLIAVAKAPEQAPPSGPPEQASASGIFGRAHQPEEENAFVTAGAGEPPEITLPLEEEMEIGIQGPNVLRMERLMLSVNGSPAFETLPLTFVEQVKRAKAAQYLAFDFSEGFGFPSRPAMHFPVELCYTVPFGIEKMPAELSLMHDARALMGEYRIWVNGSELKREDFTRKRLYDQNNLFCDILALVREGENVITVRVTATKEWHGLSDCLYLLGDFGVTERNTIGEKKRRGYFGAADKAGYPFYSGRITYSFEHYLPREAVCFALPADADFYECAELFINGQSMGTRAFAPYRIYLKRDESRGKICKISLAVDNTLIHMLEGAKYDYGKQRVIKCKEAGRQIDKCQKTGLQS